MNSHKHTFLFFGRSGAGKGTQAKLIQDYLEARGRRALYIETGQELRKFTESQNITSTLAKQVMDRGEFLPAFLPVWIWTNVLIQTYTGEEDLILDGLARRFHEAPILDSALRFYGCENVHVIHVNVSPEWSRERLLARGRGDDKEAEIQRRLTAFDHNVLPVLDYFKNQKGYDFFEVNGMQTIEEVHRDIVEHVFEGQ